jgi:tripartite-type tricarboxylate transporter receptor subunit TctC
MNTTHLNGGTARRTWLARLAAGLLAGAAFAPLATHAQGGNYPNKPVKLVVPYAPGGFSDVVARVLGQAMSKSWGQPVVIDNRAGANGVIGTQVVAQAPADGYTLLLVLDSHASNQSLLKTLPYDSVKSFAPIGLLGTAPMVLIANTQFTPNTAQELVKAAKAAPGSINYGSLGPGSQIQLAARMLENSAGIRMNAVPYKGGAPALNDLMGGHIQLMFASATSAAPYIQQRRAKALGVAATKRLAMLPDVPTLAEQGYPAVEMGFWVGLMAPAGTPERIVAKAAQTLAEVASQPDTGGHLAQLGVQVGVMGPAEFGKFLDVEIVRWGEMLRRENVKPTD